MSHAKKMRLFESFWECGEARAGEAGARGWVVWVEMSKGLLAAGLRDGTAGVVVVQGDSYTEHVTGLSATVASKMS